MAGILFYHGHRNCSDRLIRISRRKKIRFDAAVSFDVPVYKIASRAFSGTKQLKGVVLEGVYQIMEDAFEDCPVLTAVWLPKKLKKIGKNAFLGCPNLRFVFFEGGEKEWWDTLLRDGVIPEGNASLFQTKLFFDCFV